MAHLALLFFSPYFQTLCLLMSMQHFARTSLFEAYRALNVPFHYFTWRSNNPKRPFQQRTYCSSRLWEIYVYNYLSVQLLGWINPATAITSAHACTHTITNALRFKQSLMSNLEVVSLLYLEAFSISSYLFPSLLFWIIHPWLHRFRTVQLSSTLSLPHLFSFCLQALCSCYSAFPGASGSRMLDWWCNMSW